VRSLHTHTDLMRPPPRRCASALTRSTHSATRQQPRARVRVLGVTYLCTVSCVYARAYLNTRAHTGFAIGSAVLTSIALMTAFTQRVLLKEINLVATGMADPEGACACNVVCSIHITPPPLQATRMRGWRARLSRYAQLT
jgi:hypothetical protein